MEAFLLAAYLVLAVLALLQGLLLALQTWEHRRYGRSCMANLGRGRPSGHVAVFAPCKGVDVGLEANLRALLRQDYDDYDVTFIVDSADDPACEVIGRVTAAHPEVPSRLVVAHAATDTGQKVHNLRAATADVPPHVKYLAFVDSDAGPRPEWLRTLAWRLSAEGVAAATGYRWFVPTRNTAANYILYSINCGVMALLGRKSHYLIWGGSWGIRREAFDAIGLHAAWEGTLSDDLVASRQLRRARLTVRFEPACVVASPLDCSPREMLAFIRRQYLVGRFYTPVWWAFGLAVASLPNLVWLGSVAALAASIIYGTPPVWLVLGVCAALYLLCVQRGYVRQALLGTYFPERRHALRGAARFDILAGPLAAMVGWVGMLGSLFGKHIHWRGITYRVFPGGKMRVVGRRPESIQYSEQNDQRQPPDVSTIKLPRYRKAG